jgi:hypothetical protein
MEVGVMGNLVRFGLIVGMVSLVAFAGGVVANPVTEVLTDVHSCDSGSGIIIGSSGVCCDVRQPHVSLKPSQCRYK